ncbi:hypothetical protein BUALT_Bualt03G0221100 [Buddleja alternifolia]|uniref:Protein kinase domain-containing protein n=1 Tax=Buddleja alternifolia TaxID=168488 RepID=A0AAV6Y6L0_9LAMI|nr:hypothetical protein BUALT_Bualt03G0221100 [Buddleja alternifolia]
MILLSYEKLKTHPGMVKLYRYCLEGDHLGLVYEVKPFNSVYNLIPKDKIDVFGFGAILLSLIMKRVYTEEERLRSAPFVYKLALNEYEEYEYGSESESEVNRPKFSVVHQSLAAEPGYCPDDGQKLSMMEWNV